MAPSCFLPLHFAFPERDGVSVSSLYLASKFVYKNLIPKIVMEVRLYTLSSSIALVTLQRFPWDIGRFLV